MRKFALGILIVVIASIAGIVFVVARNAASDSPVEVTQHMIRALERHDLDTFKATFCDPDLAQLVFTSAQTGAQFTDLTYDEAPHPMGGIRVTITGGAEAPGSVNAEAIMWAVWLQQSGGHWCIMSLDKKP